MIVVFSELQMLSPAAYSPRYRWERTANSAMILCFGFWNPSCTASCILHPARSFWCGEKITFPLCDLLHLWGCSSTTEMSDQTSIVRLSGGKVSGVQLNVWLMSWFKSFFLWVLFLKCTFVQICWFNNIILVAWLKKVKILAVTLTWCRWWLTVSGRMTLMWWSSFIFNLIEFCETPPSFDLFFSIFVNW